MDGIGNGPRILVEFSLFGMDVRITQTVLSSFLVMITRTSAPVLRRALATLAIL